ncbi:MULTISPECIES: flagellar hook protein FlgE [unclassified Halomonas]|uniref:flagellar hook protein FlgE n=1 Tax=unclassified Halomonas TaxID=2609666 RepID=UPI001BE7F757|nr:MULTISPECIES: flagellar hook protein FlgE [unclassified Halomonas]MBT2785926.1 flagellar hook protein FlgE [Halomonas sp. ISL-106]MBT2799216.1 flagellar hook protein FlgE [Halomonas sp. ISL-104]
MSFSQALSGLSAQQQKLGAVGNNIANSQTVGFKSSNVQFADVYAESRIGLGVRTSTVQQNFSQGNVESTNRNMDLAIAGEGFFRFQQPNGEVGYSRNGQLTMTADGRLVNAQGAQIMGYAANADGVVQAGGDVNPLRVEAGNLPANATTELNVSLSLDSGEGELVAPTEAEILAGLDADDYSYSTNATIYDSQGNARNLTYYFTKTDSATNQWDVSLRMSGGPEGAGTYAVAGLTTLDFDASGRLEAGGEATFAFAADEFDGIQLENLEVDVDFAGSSQSANNSTVNDIEQDGYTAGSLVGITIEDDGTVMRNYSNEESRAAGQIALVSFRNPEGLKPDGDNLWTATGASGQELVGAPGTGQRGLIEPSAVETSNVDMARELVDMIVAQRAYQANSQTISTQDELLQTIINL